MTDAAEHREREDRPSFEDRRDLHRGFSDAMARAVELAVTPTIMGFLGWMLDRWLGTTPVLMLGLGLFTVVYLGWRMMVGYDAAMREQERRLYAPRRGRPS